MKFAFDTFRDAFGDDSERRINAIMTLVLWTVAGTYLASTAEHYLSFYESELASLGLGAVIGAILATVKLS